MNATGFEKVQLHIVSIFQWMQSYNMTYQWLVYSWTVVTRLTKNMIKTPLLLSIPVVVTTSPQPIILDVIKSTEILPESDKILTHGNLLKLLSKHYNLHSAHIKLASIIL
jgi:hypothetical protein